MKEVWFRGLGFEEFHPTIIRDADECPNCKGYGTEENCDGGQSPCYVCQKAGCIDMSDAAMVSRLEEVNYYRGAIDEPVIDMIDSLLTGYEMALDNILYKNADPSEVLEKITKVRQALDQARDELG